MCPEGTYLTGTYKEIPWKGTLQSPRPNERVRIKVGRNGKEHSGCLQKCLEISEERCCLSNSRNCWEWRCLREESRQNRWEAAILMTDFFSHTDISHLESLEHSWTFLQTVALCPWQMLHPWQVKAGDTLKLADLFSHEGDSWLVKKGILYLESLKFLRWLSNKHTVIWEIKLRRISSLAADLRSF